MAVLVLPEIVTTYMLQREQATSSMPFRDDILYLLNRDNVASLTLLADMTAQAKTIEILISHVHEVSTCNFSLYTRGME